MMHQKLMFVSWGKKTKHKPELFQQFQVYSELRKSSFFIIVVVVIIIAATTAIILCVVNHVDW